jgi:hypothetical protein
MKQIRWTVVALFALQFALFASICFADTPFSGCDTQAATAPCDTSRLAACRIVWCVDAPIVEASASDYLMTVGSTQIRLQASCSRLSAIQSACYAPMPTTALSLFPGTFQVSRVLNGKESALSAPPVSVTQVPAQTGCEEVDWTASPPKLTGKRVPVETPFGFRSQHNAQAFAVGRWLMKRAGWLVEWTRVQYAQATILKGSNEGGYFWVVAECVGKSTGPVLGL